MAGDISGKKSAVEIFENMDYGKKKLDTSLARDWLNANKKIDCWINGKFFKCKNPSYDSITSFDGTNLAEVIDGTSCIDTVVESSVKAQLKWEAFSGQEKYSTLYKISKKLQSKSELFSQLSYFSCQKNDFSLFVDYFNYYSDWALLLDENKNWKPYGVVLVVLSEDSPLHALAMTVAPALASGCSVIIKPSRKSPFCAFLLAEICTLTGLPDGLLNVIPGSKKVVEGLLLKKINKVVLNGNYLIAENLVQKHIGNSFSFLSYNNTSAVILESSDLDSAVNKIFTETWDVHYYSEWGVGMVVVQESVSQAFVEKLKRHVKQFSYGSEISMKFKNERILGKIHQIVTNARNVGITVESGHLSEETWSPTALIGYRNEDIEPSIPLLTVLICRTAKEAVNLVNSSRYALATSIWTEISSQALEVASLVRSNTVWVNCHGVSDVGIPIQPSCSSGDGLFNGKEGLIEYMYRKTEESGDNAKHPDEKEIASNKTRISKTVQSSLAAFNKWRCEKNRKKYLHDIAETLSSDKDSAQFSHLVNYWAANSRKFSISTEQNVHKELFVTQTKESVGVIAIFMNDSSETAKNFASLASPAIAFGNSVVFVTPRCNGLVAKLITQFNKHLPSNLLSVVCENEAESSLASDPDVNAVWMHNESITGDRLQGIKRLTTKHLKRLWTIPTSVPKCRELFLKECTKNKVIWFTKVNQFP